MLWFWCVLRFGNLSSYNHFRFWCEEFLNFWVYHHFLDCCLGLVIGIAKTLWFACLKPKLFLAKQYAFYKFCIFSCSELCKSMFSVALWYLQCNQQNKWIPVLTTHNTHGLFKKKVCTCTLDFHIEKMWKFLSKSQCTARYHFFSSCAHALSLSCLEDTHSKKHRWWIWLEHPASAVRTSLYVFGIRWSEHSSFGQSQLPPSLNFKVYFSGRKQTSQLLSIIFWYSSWLLRSFWWGLLTMLPALLKKFSE